MSWKLLTSSFPLSHRMKFQRGFHFALHLLLLPFSSFHRRRKSLVNGARIIVTFQLEFDIMHDGANMQMNRINDRNRIWYLKMRHRSFFHLLFEYITVGCVFNSDCEPYQCNVNKLNMSVLTHIHYIECFGCCSWRTAYECLLAGFSQIHCTHVLPINRCK